jgi:N-dimethylarginine dimethylaminohydrolase
LGRVLREAGVHLLSPKTQPGAFCQVYTRDPCFVVGRTLFVSRMREPYRRLETPGLADIRARVGAEVALDDGVIEGGDVMAVREDVVLVGTGDITDGAGVAALRRHLEPRGITVVRVPHGALHLDCCLAPLPNRAGLFSVSRLPAASRERLSPYFADLIPLPPREDLGFLAANLLWLNPEEVVSTAHAPQTNAGLRQMGYAVHEVEYSEVIHLWGSVRCTVAPLLRRA